MTENAAVTILTRGVFIPKNRRLKIAIIGAKLNMVLMQNPRPFRAKQTLCFPKIPIFVPQNCAIILAQNIGAQSANSWYKTSPKMYPTVVNVAQPGLGHTGSAPYYFVLGCSSERTGKSTEKSLREEKNRRRPVPPPYTALLHPPGERACAQTNTRPTGSDVLLCFPFLPCPSQKWRYRLPIPTILSCSSISVSGGRRSVG